MLQELPNLCLVPGDRRDVVQTRANDFALQGLHQLLIRRETVETEFVVIWVPLWVQRGAESFVRSLQTVDVLEDQPLVHGIMYFEAGLLAQICLGTDLLWSGLLVPRRLHPSQHLLEESEAPLRRPQIAQDLHTQTVLVHLLPGLSLTCVDWQDLGGEALADVIQLIVHLFVRDFCHFWAGRQTHQLKREEGLRLRSVEHP